MRSCAQADYEDLPFDFCGGFVGYLGWVILKTFVACIYWDYTLCLLLSLQRLISNLSLLFSQQNRGMNCYCRLRSFICDEVNIAL